VKNSCIVFLFCSIFATGCASIPKSSPIQTNGYFPTSKSVDEKYISKKIAPSKQYKIVYLREIIKYSLLEEIKQGYRELHKKALIDMGYEVYRPNEIVDFMKEQNINMDSSYADNESLKRLQDKVGDILVVEIYYEQENSEWDRYSIKASDLNKQTLFHLSYLPFVWSNFEKEMIYPAFNRLIDWKKS
jgi:hypothetical protein